MNGVSGIVEEIGSAMAKVRSPNGKLHLAPNSRFQEHVVEKHERIEEDAQLD